LPTRAGRAGGQEKVKSNGNSKFSPVQDASEAARWELAAQVKMLHVYRLCQNSLPRGKREYLGKCDNLNFENIMTRLCEHCELQKFYFLFEKM
jgi:hypothetical protein